MRVPRCVCPSSQPAWLCSRVFLMPGDFGVDRVDRVGGRKVCLLESFWKDESCYIDGQNMLAGRAQVTSKSYTRRGCYEGAARWFEAGTGAKVGPCWFGAGGLMGSEQGENQSGAATDMCRQAHGCLAEDWTRCQEE